jgi:glutaredoxin
MASDRPHPATSERRNVKADHARSQLAESHLSHGQGRLTVAPAHGQHRSHQRLLTLVVGLLLAMATLAAPASTKARGPVLHVYVREGCPHCAAAEAYLGDLQRSTPKPPWELRLHRLEADPQALTDLQAISRRAGIRTPGVPTFVIGATVLVGFDGPGGVGRQLEELLRQQQQELRAEGLIRAGPLGQLGATHLGLPLFTLALGLLDGFNPCAMWVLLFLLSLLVHWRDRRRLALVAGTFVLVSGAVYYAFMAAWLNVFLVLGLSRQIQLLLGAVALVVGAVNLGDASRPSQGYTLAIPAGAKPGLYARMRGVLQSRGLAPALAGVALLALVVNLVELLCTAGLPALYTAVLSQQALPAWGHYSYLALYILGYIADDALMVGLTVWALGNRRLSPAAGRRLKLLSGGVMLSLGLVLLLRPGWLI